MQVMGAWKFVRSLPANLSVSFSLFLLDSARRTLLPETIIQYKKSNKVC